MSLKVIDNRLDSDGLVIVKRRLVETDSKTYHVVKERERKNLQIVDTLRLEMHSINYKLTYSIRW